MKKIILLLVLMLTLVFYGCSLEVETNTYESDIDDFSVDYDDDKDIYDVFIKEEQRHIYINRSNSTIIISDDTEVIVEETYFKIDGTTRTKIYFYIDWSSINESKL